MIDPKQVAGLVLGGVYSTIAMLPALGAEPLRDLTVTATAVTGHIRSLQGVDGLPVGVDGAGIGIEAGPDVRGGWKKAHVDAVRTYIWHSRLDTVDNPGSLFPKWNANPDLVESYNFEATDAAVRATREAGADVLFTVASSIPQNNKPPADLVKWSTVLNHIVKHYTTGWGSGFQRAIRYWEIGDEPDLNKFHFSGTPEQFYAMYAAGAREIKSVDSTLQVGGPGLAFPYNVGAPHREGFLAFVKHHRVPFDFFSWKWFADATEDPWDFHRVAEAATAELEKAGLQQVRQFVTNWNYYAIPTSSPNRLTMGVFESAALSYMQDTKIDRAYIFRGDASMRNPKYKKGDEHVQMFNPDGTPMLNAWGFIAMGQMQRTPQRLAVTGADDRGFAVLAGKDESSRTAQVLITNYAIAPRFLEPTTRTSLDFDLPVDGQRVPVSMSLPKRRTEAVESRNGGYHLKLSGMSCSGGCTIQRRRLDETHAFTQVDNQRTTADVIELSAELPPPSLELITITQGNP
jgi:xylan 1,4-beta-xylosidase